jgi:PAS domain S-box-containing protein
MWDRLRRFIPPPVFDEQEKARVSTFMSSLGWAAIGVVSLTILFHMRTVRGLDTAVVATLLAFIAVVLGMQYVVRRGFIHTAAVLVTLSMWAALTYIAFQADGLRDSSLIAYFIVVLVSSILLGWHYVLLFGLLSLGVVWSLAVMEQNGLRPMQLDSPLGYAWDLSIILVLVIALTYLPINSWIRALKAARGGIKERLRAEEKLQRQANYLALLNETALGILNRSELDPVLEAILSRSCELVDTQHGQIELILPDGSALRQHLGHGMLTNYNGCLRRKGEGLTGAVWESGKAILVEDYSTWGNALPEFVDEGIRCALGVPLKLGEVVTGVMAVALVNEERKFTAEQVDLMERLASLAALAIHNARLYEQAQKEILERRTAEAGLRASEERFKMVFQASPVAICITAAEDGRLLEANEAFWKISGFDPSTSIGRTTLDLNMVDSMEEHLQLVDRLRRERSIYNPDDDFLTPRAEQRSVHTFHEMVELRGQPCILTMLYDVTPQKQAQNALKAAEARTRAILAAIPDMIFEFSREGGLTGYIPSTELSPITAPEQFLGRNIRELFPAEIARQALFAIDRALETNQIHAFEYGMPPGEEVQFFEARVSAISPDLAMVMVRDISQRKWIETEREKLIRELEGKNAELERFTYAVSHDLKSPLITIKGFLKFLEQDTKTGNLTRLKADLRRIEEATDKMQSLLNELLELSRVGRLRNPPELVPFRDLAVEAVELVQGRLLQAGAEVEIHAGLPVVYGDRHRLTEVLQNLVDNAAKFFGDQPHPRIEIGQAGEEDGRPILFVRDNGIGIEAGHLDRIFGLFNKLSTESEGTGIGLTLVKRIVEEHRGRIWVESQVGVGSTFFYTLQTGAEG